MRYQHFASHTYCGAAGPVSKMASQQEKAFCVLRFEVSRSVITRFRKDAPGRRFFSKPCTKLTLHCNHRSGHLKTEHTESLFLLRRHLGNWPRSKHEKQIAGSAWKTWTVAAADGVSCVRVRWETNLLLTFENVPFYWVYPVYSPQNLFGFVPLILSEIFLFLRIIRQDIVTKVQRFSPIVPVIIVRF